VQDIGLAVLVVVGVTGVILVALVAIPVMVERGNLMEMALLGLAAVAVQAQIFIMPVVLSDGMAAAVALVFLGLVVMVLVAREVARLIPAVVAVALEEPVEQEVHLVRQVLGATMVVSVDSVPERRMV
jgi:hypothetical protein